MIAIDIFSGAGGMSLGAMMADIEIVTAVERDPNAAETFQVNHPDSEVICDDITNVSFANSRITPFVVFGGPPCQGFSSSNTKTRNSENKNNSLFHQFIRIVDELKPKWFVFENVEGITTFENGTVVDKLIKEFKRIGYETNNTVLVASDYGVPQSRNRFFMVGNRLGIDYIFPEKLSTKVSVLNAIGDLPELQNGQLSDELPYKNVRPSRYASTMRGNNNVATQNYVSRNRDYVIERYKYIGQGENWKSIPSEMMKNYKNSENCHSGIYRRLDPNKPSVVIANYRKNMLIHPFQNRGLSVREAARLQSFPDNFIFKGSLTSIQQQIGNAVPPLLAYSIFSQIIHLTPQNERQ